jgi:hypothetical protein
LNPKTILKPSSTSPRVIPGQVPHGVNSGICDLSDLILAKAGIDSVESLHDVFSLVPAMHCWSGNDITVFAS